PVPPESVDGDWPRRHASGLSRAGIRALHFREQPAALLSALAGVHECRELGGYLPRPDHGPLRGHGYCVGLLTPASLAGRAALYTGSEDNEVMHTSAQTATVMVTPRQALWLELMQFYIREAWLLDERKFTEWLDLFTEDVLYFMPRRKNVPRRELHREVTSLGNLALFEDDKRYLEMGVPRLDTGMPWAADPPSRPLHPIQDLV